MGSGLISGNGVVENVIVYGLEATNADCQGLFSDDLDEVNDVAFVIVGAQSAHQPVPLCLLVQMLA